MELTNKLIEKVGVDKLLHFLVTAWLIAEAKVYGVVTMIIVFLLIVILGIIKEKKLDVNPDYSDLKWSIYGGLVSMCLYAASKLLGA